MPVTISYPRVLAPHVRAELRDTVRGTIRRWRPSFESWRLALSRSPGRGWRLAISGPRLRKVFALHGPHDDLPELVGARMDAALARRELG